MHTDVLIIGAGPAGLAAAITLASEGKSVIILEKNKQAGGQAGTTSLIENYPPFPCGVSGADLTQAACSQCEKFGVEIRYEDEAGVVVPLPGGTFVAHGRHTDVYAKAVLLATGLQNRWLGVPGEDLPHVHHGMKVDALDEHCNRAVVLVGGGNSAGQAAVYYLERGAEVFLMIRRPLAETMSDYLIKRIGRAVVFESQVTGIAPSVLKGRLLVSGSSGGVDGVDCVHIFVGQKPGTEWLTGLIELDENGYIQTDNKHMTSRPGLFAVGDVVSDAVRRVSCAVGYGNEVVPAIHRYLDASV